MNVFNRVVGFFTKPSVVIVYLLVVSLGFFYIDKPIAEFFASTELPHSPLIRIISLFGKTAFWLVFFPLAALCFKLMSRPRQVFQCLFLWACVSVAAITTVILKISLGRARPIMWLNDHVYGFYGFGMSDDFWSFPSGHASAVTALLVGLIILFPKKTRWLCLGGLFILMTRIILTKHYFSDVLATGYLTLLEFGLLFYWLGQTSWIHEKLYLTKE